MRRSVVWFACAVLVAGAAAGAPSPSPSPTAPARIEEQVAPQAEWLVGRLTRLHYKLDYTPASLWEVDRFVAEGFPDGQPLPRLRRDVGRIIFGMGAYAGEVVRRAKGGRWHWGGRPDDPEAEVGIELKLPDGTALQPMRRSLARIREGFTASLADFARGPGLAVGAPPAWAKSAWSRPRSPGR